VAAVIERAVRDAGDDFVLPLPKWRRIPEEAARVEAALERAEDPHCSMADDGIATLEMLDQFSDELTTYFAPDDGIAVLMDSCGLFLIFRDATFTKFLTIFAQPDTFEDPRDQYCLPLPGRRLLTSYGQSRAFIWHLDALPLERGSFYIPGNTDRHSGVIHTHLVHYRRRFFYPDCVGYEDCPKDGITSMAALQDGRIALGLTSGLVQLRAGDAPYTLQQLVHVALPGPFPVPTVAVVEDGPWAPGTLLEEDCYEGEQSGEEGEREVEVATTEMVMRALGVTEPRDVCRRVKLHALRDGRLAAVQMPYYGKKVECGRVWAAPAWLRRGGAVAAWVAMRHSAWVAGAFE